MRRIALFALLLAAALAQAALSSPAQARVSFTAPAIATTADRVVLRGTAGRARRVAIERRAGGRWRRIRSARGPRYGVRWRVPARRGIVTLRAAGLRRGRRIGVSRPRRIAVSALEVLAPRRVVAAPPPGAPGAVRYRGRVPATPGEYVALDVGPATPEGMLARVVARHSAGGETVLHTVPASIVDAVPEGSISAGSVRSAAARAAAGPKRFRAGFGCSGGVLAELDGSLAVAIDPRFALAWSRGRVRRATAAATVSGDVELIARVGGRAACELAPTPVARWDAPPLRFAVGPIPVVIVPRTVLHVAGTAEASTAVEAGIRGSLSATAGLRYGADVEPIGAFRHELAPIPPSARTDAAIGARLIPSVTFLMYGQAGPRFDLAVGLRLEASADGPASWTLTAPVKLSAGLRVPRFPGLDLEPRTVFEHSFPIAEGSAGDEPSPPRRRAVASWDSPETDVDLHVWDAAGRHAWFGDKAAIPGTLLSTDDTDGFGPEFFDETGSSGGAFTYGLCYFDDHGLGPTRVAVRLTDSDGGTRETVHTLRASGDSVVIGASPAGAAGAPPPGWCAPR